MESSGKAIEFLKETYVTTPAEGSDAKRVKASDIQDNLSRHFPGTLITPHTSSLLVQEAFPNSSRKRLGRDRQTFVVGIQPQSAVSVPAPFQEANLQEENRILSRKVLELEDKVRALEEQAHNSHSLELDNLLRHGKIALHGPDTPVHFDEFSVEDVIKEFQQYAPNIYHLFLELGNTERRPSGSQAPVEEKKALMSMCTILNARSRKAHGMQLLMSFMLIARATSRQAMTVLNYAGVCMSYQRSWEYLRQLTAEAELLQVVRSGHWLWVYDNVNLHQKVRHEREDRHSRMLNMTARLAVEVKHLPPWEVNWCDASPQRDTATLTISDILPNERDGVILKRRAVDFIMQFLVAEFKSLHHLEPLIPPKEGHSVRKSNVVPMKLLFLDEKYKAETTEILTTIASDAGLTGKPEIIVGDQLTCKIVRGAKRWRECDTTPVERLQWALEVPGDFHFLWECLRVLLQLFWGTPKQTGSLCHLRELVHRVQVDKSGKVFNTCDEFVLHAFKGHLVAAICTYLNIHSKVSPIKHDSSLQWLEQTALAVTKEVLYPPSCHSDDGIYSLHRSFLHMAFLYYDLRTAIRFEDGEHIIRHWKLWIPQFLATGCKNYALEAANHLVNIIARFPKHISYIAVNNRTVNMDGKQGHGKPIDQAMEHYNLVLKQALRASGANATHKHIEDVSLCSLFLMEAAKTADRAFGLTPRAAKHAVADASGDINKIADNLLEQKVTLKMNRSVAFRDSTMEGFKKMTPAWLKQVLTLDSESLAEQDLHTLPNTEESECTYELYDVL